MRITRDQDNQNELFGYQRPEVFAHIKEISRYLESENPLMPNALVIAFERVVDFEAFQDQASSSNASTAGLIEIPCPDNDNAKIGWIVDGQQHAATIRDSIIDSFRFSGSIRRKPRRTT